MDNKLHFLRSNCFEIEKIPNSKFEELQTLGFSPCPRAHHSLNLLQHKMALVLVGGLDSNESPLADVWLFHLLEATWMQVQMEPSLELKFGGIFKHSSIAHGDEVLIYGGKHTHDQGICNFINLQLGKELSNHKPSQPTQN